MADTEQILVPHSAGARAVLAEGTVRWLLTIAYVACTLGLMWTLGVTAAPWAAWLAGCLMFGTPAARLWASHLETVQNERIRAELDGHGPTFTATRSGRDDVAHEQPEPSWSDENQRYP